MDPAVKATLEASHQYGLANTLTVVLVIFFLGIFFFMLRWVVKLNETMTKNSHEEKMALAAIVNGTLRSIADTIHMNTTVCQQIMSNVKDGFDNSKKADDFHRQDLSKILDAVRDNECKAP